jgi:hypothetical protein
MSGLLRGNDRKVSLLHSSWHMQVMVSGLSSCQFPGSWTARPREYDKTIGRPIILACKVTARFRQLSCRDLHAPDLANALRNIPGSQVLGTSRSRTLRGVQCTVYLGLRWTARKRVGSSFSVPRCTQYLELRAKTIQTCILLTVDQVARR